MQQLLRLAQKHSTPIAISLAMVATMCICWLDTVAPADYGIAMLYWLPILVARWWGSRMMGVTIAVACTLAEVYTNVVTGAYTFYPNHTMVALWGVALHLVAYLGVMAMLAWVKGLILKEITARIAESVAKEELLCALNNVRELEGLLPICSWCKKIRDDSGFWVKVEGYIAQHSKAKFTHGICPDCKPKFIAGHIHPSGHSPQ